MKKTPNKDLPASTMTKFEMAVFMAMQGLLASFTEKSSIGAWGTEIPETVKASIELAKETFKQLEQLENET